MKERNCDGKVAVSFRCFNFSHLRSKRVETRASSLIRYLNTYFSKASTLVKGLWHINTLKTIFEHILREGVYKHTSMANEEEVVIKNDNY